MEQKHLIFLHQKNVLLVMDISMDKVAKVVYGAAGVSWSPEAEAKAKAFEADKKYDEYATMMVKTHLSLTHDPTIKGTPKPIHSKAVIPNGSCREGIIAISAIFISFHLSSWGQKLCHSKFVYRSFIFLISSASGLHDSSVGESAEIKTKW